MLSARPKLAVFENVELLGHKPGASPSSTSCSGASVEPGPSSGTDVEYIGLSQGLAAWLGPGVAVQPCIGNLIVGPMFGLSSLRIVAMAGPSRSKRCRISASAGAVDDAAADPGQPDSNMTFAVREIQGAGYRVHFQTVQASDYGVPNSRGRDHEPKLETVALLAQVAYLDHSRCSRALQLARPAGFMC